MYLHFFLLNLSVRNSTLRDANKPWGLSGPWDGFANMQIHELIDLASRRSVFRAGAGRTGELCAVTEADWGRARSPRAGLGRAQSGHTPDGTASASAATTTGSRAGCSCSDFTCPWGTAGQSLGPKAGYFCLWCNGSRTTVCCHTLQHLISLKVCLHFDDDLKKLKC